MDLRRQFEKVKKASHFTKKKTNIYTIGINVKIQPGN